MNNLTVFIVKIACDKNRLTKKIVHIWIKNNCYNKNIFGRAPTNICINLPRGHAIRYGGISVFYLKHHMGR